MRDTSGQDRPLTKSALAGARRWGAYVAVGAGLAVAIAIVARGWLLGDRAVDRSRVRIAKVIRGPLVRDVVGDGRVVAASSPTLYTPAAGMVDLKVQAGDAVTKGQELATIASPELESTLRQEEATLAGLEDLVGRARLQVQQGKANAQKLIDQAEIDRKAAARELERNRQFYDTGAIPEMELRRSEDTLEKAEIALAHAKSDAKLEGKGLAFDLGAADRAVERQREVVTELQRQVAALVLVSPVDGQVGQVFVAQRATVAASAAILGVVDLTAFELEVAIPDSFAHDLAIGMTAEIRSGAATFAGRVRSVAPEVVDGRVASRLEFVGAKPDGLRQNQRLTARILIEERADVLQVERGPFVEGGGGNVAYVVVDGVAERRAIQVGALSLGAVELVAGARVGDQIVVSGSDAFGDAERVRLE